MLGKNPGRLPDLLVNGMKLCISICNQTRTVIHPGWKKKKVQQVINPTRFFTAEMLGNEYQIKCLIYARTENIFRRKKVFCYVNHHINCQVSYSCSTSDIILLFIEALSGIRRYKHLILFYSACLWVYSKYVRSRSNWSNFQSCINSSTTNFDNVRTALQMCLLCRSADILKVKNVKYHRVAFQWSRSLSPTGF